METPCSVWCVGFIRGNRRRAEKSHANERRGGEWVRTAIGEWLLRGSRRRMGTKPIQEWTTVCFWNAKSCFEMLKCRLISFNYSSFSMLIEASNSLQERRERERGRQALSAARYLCVKAAREFLAGASSGLSLQVIRTRLWSEVFRSNEFPHILSKMMK